MKFKIFGTQIHITFLFMAFITILIATDKSGFLLFMMVSVILHEMAHLFVMRKIGSNPKSVKLIPACIQISRGIGSKSGGDIFVSLAGPLINLLLFAAFYINSLIYPSEKVMTFAAVNLILGAINLLPAKGLDGGCILYSLLKLKLNEGKCRLILNISTVAVCFSALIIGIYLYLKSNGNVSLIIFSLYLLMSVLIKY